MSVRVLAADFPPDRSMTVSSQSNLDSSPPHDCRAVASISIRLFRAYIEARHCDGGMADMTVLDYAHDGRRHRHRHVSHRISFEARWASSKPFRPRPLLAVALCDRLSDGLSMVYSFYDPDIIAPQPRHLHDPRHIAFALELGSAAISISATGSMARARCPTRRAFSRKSGSASTAGNARSPRMRSSSGYANLVSHSASLPVIPRASP